MSIQQEHYEDAEEYAARAEDMLFKMGSEEYEPHEFWALSRMAEIHAILAGGFNPDSAQKARNRQAAEARASQSNRQPSLSPPAKVTRWGQSL